MWPEIGKFHCLGHFFNFLLFSLFLKITKKITKNRKYVQNIFRGLRKFLNVFCNFWIIFVNSSTVCICFYCFRRNAVQSAPCIVCFWFFRLNLLHNECQTERSPHQTKRYYFQTKRWAFSDEVSFSLELLDYTLRLCVETVLSD